MSKHRNRLVVKVGSSSLTDDHGRISEDKILRLVAQIAALQKNGLWQAVLVSSGAIAAGLGRLGWQRAHISMPEKQAAAAVGQTVLMQTYERHFAAHGLAVGQLLLTRSDVEDRRRFIHIRNTVLALLRHGIIPIINENDTVAVDEIRFGDNDTLAGLTALVSEADRLLLLTDIDGLYTGNPRLDPSATLIAQVPEISEEIEALAGGPGSSVGTGGMRTKIIAAKVATQAGVETVIANGEAPDVLVRIANGERIGTWFRARTERVGLRKSWLMHAPKPDGSITIDAGAAQAILKSSGSLLLPGILEVEGAFHEGGVVMLTRPDGLVVAKGIASYSAKDLTDLLNRRKQGEALYNVHEVIHRNDMVLMEEANR